MVDLFHSKLNKFELAEYLYFVRVRDLGHDPAVVEPEVYSLERIGRAALVRAIEDVV